MTFPAHCIFITLAGMLAATSVAADWHWQPRKLAGDYTIYSGSLADMAPRTVTDQKLAISVRGKAAQDIFNAIGPDIKTCGWEEGLQIRQRADGNVSCTRTRQGEYSCHFGFDLRTGDSIPGVVC